MSTFGPRHLLGIEPLTRAEIETVLELSGRFLEINERPIKKVPTLRGKTVINLFLEPSTRTRTSFEIAAKRLSADAVNISGSASSTSTMVRPSIGSTRSVGPISGLGSPRNTSSR